MSVFSLVELGPTFAVNQIYSDQSRKHGSISLVPLSCSQCSPDRVGCPGSCLQQEKGESQNNRSLITIKQIHVIQLRTIRKDSDSDHFLCNTYMPCISYKTVTSTTKCFFKHFVCFLCRLTEFETEFDINSLFLHISHFHKLVCLQNSTNNFKTACIKYEHVHIARCHLADFFHKGYSLWHAAAHNHTTSDLHATCKFWELLSNTSYICANEIEKLVLLWFWSRVFVPDEI
jgi:hypothetical protein